MSGVDWSVIVPNDYDLLALTHRFEDFNISSGTHHLVLASRNESNELVAGTLTQRSLQKFNNLRATRVSPGLYSTPLFYKLNEHVLYARSVIASFQACNGTSSRGDGVQFEPTRRKFDARFTFSQSQASTMTSSTCYSKQKKIHYTHLARVRGGIFAEDRIPRHIVAFSSSDHDTSNLL